MNMRQFGIALLGLAVAGLTFGQEAKEEKAPAAEKKPEAATAAPRVALDTSMGKIVLELDEEKAPETVKNFLKYVDDKYYDGTIFHRVIDGFMIQGGGFEIKDDQVMQKKTNAPIKNEAKNGLSNARGTIAMARTNNPHSATSQFFINVVDNPNLNPGGFSPDGYAVFGKVVEGLDVVDKIRKVKTGAKVLMALDPSGKHAPQRGEPTVPVENVIIKSATRVKN